jgi:hypothetical protein
LPAFSFFWTSAAESLSQQQQQQQQVFLAEEALSFILKVILSHKKLFCQELSLL